MCGRHVYKPNAGLQSTQVEFKVYHFSFIAELLRNWTRGHRQRRRPLSGLKGQMSADDMGSLRLSAWLLVLMERLNLRCRWSKILLMQEALVAQLSI